MGTPPPSRPEGSRAAWHYGIIFRPHRHDGALRVIMTCQKSSSESPEGLQLSLHRERSLEATVFGKRLLHEAHKALARALLSPYVEHLGDEGRLKVVQVLGGFALASSSFAKGKFQCGCLFV